jgi:hypothetical protein
MAWPSSGSYTAWSKCFKCTSQASKISAVLSGYFLDLSLMPSAFWGAVQSDGDDLRFTEDDGETAVSHQLIYINVGATDGLVWVAQPHGSGGASADVDTYCYVGNAGASSTSTSAGYPSTLEALWMLQEAPTSSTAVVDWSGNGNGSTSIAGSMTSGDLIAGGPFAGLKSLDFDSNDRLVFPAALFNPCEAASAFTFSCWNHPDDEDTDIGLFASEINQFQLLHKNTNAINALLRNSTNSGEAIADSGLWQQWWVDEWSLIHVTWDGSTLKAYLNGVERASVAATSVRSVDSNFSLGRGYSAFWRGKIGPTAVHSSTYSADQCATQYNNEAGTGFWVIAEVTGGGAANTTNFFLSA